MSCPIRLTLEIGGEAVRPSPASDASGLARLVMSKSHFLASSGMKYPAGRKTSAPIIPKAICHLKPNKKIRSEESTLVAKMAVRDALLASLNFWPQELHFMGLNAKILEVFFIAIPLHTGHVSSLIRLTHNVKVAGATRLYRVASGGP